MMSYFYYKRLPLKININTKYFYNFHSIKSSYLEYRQIVYLTLNFLRFSRALNPDPMIQLLMMTRILFHIHCNSKQ